MLQGDPSLAGHSIHTAAAVGDAPAAERMVRADRSLATATGGPFGWEPLMYVAYSRLVSDDPLTPTSPSRVSCSSSRSKKSRALVERYKGLLQLD